jgi:hypothetical protein
LVGSINWSFSWSIQHLSVYGQLVTVSPKASRSRKLAAFSFLRGSVIVGSAIPYLTPRAFLYQQCKSLGYFSIINNGFVIRSNHSLQLDFIFVWPAN